MKTMVLSNNEPNDLKVFVNTFQPNKGIHQLNEGCCMIMCWIVIFCSFGV